MQQTAVIVIGAGAAGLMAARTLAQAGKKVIVLEARNRTGGRIFTLGDVSFFKRAELGAEFIHGDLPLTQQLLDEAGIAYSQAGSEMYRAENGKIIKGQEQIDHWDLLMERLNGLEEDTDIDNFLEKYFAGDKYAALRKSARQFVIGYDSADPKLASAFSLRREWNDEDLEAQYRIPEGYCALIRFLSHQCKAAGGEVILSAPVTSINVEAEQVIVTTKDNTTYVAGQAVVALPLGVLQIKTGEPGAINFKGTPASLFNTFHQIGFGSIIKILVQFNKPFWEQAEHGNIAETGFILSEEEVPTWWTQSPGNPLLTGWLGGPNAKALANLSDQDIWLKALGSLSRIFNTDVDLLKSHVIAWQVANWTAEPYTRGSYAYDTVYSAEARKTLSEPIAGRLWFAGEYLYGGAAMGTVEAALQSGLMVAETMAEQASVTEAQAVDSL